MTLNPEKFERMRISLKINISTNIYHLNNTKIETVKHEKQWVFMISEEHKLAVSCAALEAQAFRWKRSSRYASSSGF
jgi:hypothetical protein